MRSRAIRLAAGALALALLPLVAARTGDYDAAGSLAADARVTTRSTAGVPRFALRGPISPDGSPSTGERSLVLARRGGEVELDFGKPVPVAAVLLQAENDDRFAVHGQEDDGSWRLLWRIPEDSTGRGLRTRVHTFEPPVTVRRLRIRSRAGSLTIGNARRNASELSAISAIRVYDELPEGWPDALAAPRRLPLPLLSRHVLVSVRLGVAITGAAALVLLFARRDEPNGARTARARRLLALSAATAGLLWWDLFQFGSVDRQHAYGHTWDVYHYYLGSKYARELGYFNLYHCVVTADLEEGLGVLQRMRGEIRELRDYELVSVDSVASNPERCKARFSEERWQAFKSDVAWFRSRATPIEWLKLQLDHGYNPSPAWAVLGSAFARLAPLSETWFAVLISLDVLLLVVMWDTAWRTFGMRPTCAALLFWGTNYAAIGWWTHGCFLRQGWLVLTVLGVCLLRQKRMGAAGFLMAYATLLRVFPGLLVAGVALQALVEMARRRRWLPSPDHRRFAAGALAGVLIVGALGALEGRRMGVWSDFVDNSRLHYDHVANNTVGAVSGGAFVLQAARGEAPKDVKLGSVPAETSASLLEARRQARRATLVLSVLLLPVFVAAIMRAEMWEAAVLGIVWIPIVSELASYYTAVFLVYGFLAVRRDGVGVSLALLAVLLAALGVADDGVQAHRVFVATGLATTAFGIGVTAAYAWRRGAQRAR